MHPGAVPAREREDQRGERQDAGQQQHERGQPVEHEHDAERRRPVAEQIDAGGRRPSRRGAGARSPPRTEVMAAQRLIAAFTVRLRSSNSSISAPASKGSSTGTITVAGPAGHGPPPGRRRDRFRSGRATPAGPSRNSAVVAKPITIAVRTSACGTGSVYCAGSPAPGGRQHRRHAGTAGAPCRR